MCRSVGPITDRILQWSRSDVMAAWHVQYFTHTRMNDTTRQHTLNDTAVVMFMYCHIILTVCATTLRQWNY